MSEELAPGLLVAMPALKDPYFEKTVILLCNYTEETAFGLVINNPSTIQIKEILSENIDLTENMNCPLLVGGPVQPESLWAVHSSDFSASSTSKIAESVYISSIQDVLLSLVRGQGPQKYHLGCGYAGWGPEQLDREIQEGAWWLSPLDSHLVLSMPYDQRWEAALKQIGIDPLTASFMPTGES